jgi:SAM-dependent methyltransferase
MGRWNSSTERYASDRPETPIADFLKSVTTAPPTIVERFLRKHFWELRFALWKATGQLRVDRDSLSIGPRWITEIKYFRNAIGLQRHIGLDLFSDDPELVVAGDMHAMPFEKGRFHFVFSKNTVDKSYNVRQLVSEMLRITAPGGLIVIDQICGYGRCSPLNRTDIQRAKNLLALFSARARVRPLVCYDVDVSGLGDAREPRESRRNARLAIRVEHTET